jgi:DNA-binding transcriptional MerR regulator
MDKQPKAVLLSGFTNEEIREFLNWYKQNKKLPRVILASVTETALEWKVKDWLKELEEEDRYFRESRAQKHKENK